MHPLYCLFMIDYPSGKTERALIWLFELFGDIFLDTKEVLLCGKERYKEISKFGKGIVFPIAIIVMILLLGLYIYDYIKTESRVNVVMVYAGEEEIIEYSTAEKRVEKFLSEHEINYIPGLDKINVKLNGPVTDGLNIRIEKAIRCTVTVDGETLTFSAFPPITVEDAINGLGITLNELDLINFDLDHEVEMNDEIVIQRVTMKYVVEEEEQPFKVEYVRDSSLTIGKTKVSKKGRKGLVENSYLIMYVDGEEVSKTLTSSEVIQKKRNKVVKYGTHILSGVPKDLKYVKKLSHCRVVSYHFGGAPRGVYGMKCKYGTCAVDRDLIPLGSKLYIEGYGYAIANDVGSAIRGKTIDVYMERMAQCGVWGARWSNVYIISYGNDKSYWE